MTKKIGVEVDIDMEGDNMIVTVSIPTGDKVAALGAMTQLFTPRFIGEIRKFADTYTED